MFLKYEMILSGVKELYFINFNMVDKEKISITKAKNLIANKVFNREMLLMNIVDEELIKRYEKEFKKRIRANTEVSYSVTRPGFESIEIEGDILKAEVKKETIKRLINNYGICEYVNAEGEKYNSDIYPNLKMFLVAKPEGMQGYYIIDSETGLMLLDTKTKTKGKIEKELKELYRDAPESEIIKKGKEKLIHLGIIKKATVTAGAENTDEKVIYKNNIIEMVEDAEIKNKIYKALEEGQKIGYTNNLREIPEATYSNKETRIYIIINPNDYQKAYISGYIYNISEAIEQHYKGLKDELKALYYEDYREFRQVIKEDSQSQPLTQYYYRDIIKYLRGIYEQVQEEAV